MSQNKELYTFPQPYKFTPYDKNDFDSDLVNNTASISKDNFRVCKVIILGDLCVGKTSLLNR